MRLSETFIIQTKSLLGEEFEDFQEALEKPASVSIRINPMKVNIPVSDTLFSNDKDLSGISNSPVPWASDAYYLDSRPSFTFDPLFHAGCYYVQEASSMFLEQVIKTYIDKPVKCLDLCAAPGGKSTQLLSLLPENSLLISNEVIRSRANVLAENIIKWGNPFNIVTNNDPAMFGRLDRFFDVIIADVPCSGEGMFRKDPGAVEEWSAANVKLCSERQRRIIAHCWDSLKSGGILVYSTCTFNTEENEDNIHWITETLGAEVLSVPADSSWGIEDRKKYKYPVSRFFPHRTKGEGFFIAVLRKNGNLKSDHKIKFQKNGYNQQKERNNAISVHSYVLSWLSTPEDFCFESENDIITAIPDIYKADYYLMKNKLKVVHAGITIGQIKGKDVIPDHSLAMSVKLKQHAFPSVELDKETAILFLRKEAILNLPADTPKEFILVCYKGYPLGFVKNIGTRANNLYPQEWRIRKVI